MAKQLKPDKIYIAGDYTQIDTDDLKEMERVTRKHNAEITYSFNNLIHSFTLEQIEADPQLYQQQLKTSAELIAQCKALMLLPHYGDKHYKLPQAEYEIARTMGKEVKVHKGIINPLKQPMPKSLKTYAVTVQTLCTLLETALLQLEDEHKKVFGQGYRHEMKQKLNRAKDSTKQVVNAINLDQDTATYYFQQADYLLATFTHLITILDQRDGKARESQNKIKAYLSRYKLTQEDKQVINKLYTNADY